MIQLSNRFITELNKIISCLARYRPTIVPFVKSLLQSAAHTFLADRNLLLSLSAMRSPNISEFPKSANLGLSKSDFPYRALIRSYYQYVLLIFQFFQNVFSKRLLELA